MRNPELEIRLRNQFEEMVNRYKWLTVRFECSEKLYVYLVSYAPVEEIEKDEEFMREVMAFEDKLNLLYGDNAPLFCDEEAYFKLSPDAEEVRYRNYEYFSMGLMENIEKAYQCEIAHILHKVQEETSFYPLAA